MAQAFASRLGSHRCVAMPSPPAPANRAGRSSKPRFAKAVTPWAPSRSWSTTAVSPGKYSGVKRFVQSLRGGTTLQARVVIENRASATWCGTRRVAGIGRISPVTKLANDSRNDRNSDRKVAFDDHDLGDHVSSYCGGRMRRYASLSRVGIIPTSDRWAPRQRSGQSQSFGCLEEGVVSYSRHFRDELANDALTTGDILTVCRSGAIAMAAEKDIKTGQWKYRIEGLTADGIPVA